MGPISHPEILVTSYQPIPCGIPEDQKPNYNVVKPELSQGIFA